MIKQDPSFGLKLKKRSKSKRHLFYQIHSERNLVLKSYLLFQTVLIENMGTMCAHPVEKQQCKETIDTAKKNVVKLKAHKNNTIFVQLVLGQYRFQKGESLLIITEGKYIHLCDALKQYATDFGRTLDTIQNMRKTFFKPTLNKTCPFKKVFVGILPIYHTEEQDEYKQLYMNVLRQALEGVKEICIEFNNTMQRVSSLPNQMLLALLLGQLSESPGLKVSLVSSERKMISMFRYELMKTQQFEMSELNQ